jgi:mono/diheme cytochrome c family protein
MGRVVLRLAALLGGALIAAGVILAVVATRRLDRRYDAPLPPIIRATSAGELARGDRLYRTLCSACHTPPGELRACGAVLPNFPASFGTIRSSDLTGDPGRGIGARSDGEIARLLRHGVRFDGRYSRTMPRMRSLGDQDIAALIGFLRSGDRRFATCDKCPVAGRLSIAGKIALAFLGPGPPRGPGGPFNATTIPVPERRPTAADGRYLATAIYGCVACHTDGVGDVESKLGAPDLLAGGLELPDPRGSAVVSTNLTPDETGIGQWTLTEFKSTLATGIDPTGSVVRPPMPILRAADAAELEAIFTYLRSVPPVKRGAAGTRPRAHVAPTTPPDEIFVTLACASCHGTGAPFRDRLRQVRGKSPATVAEAIRYPEQGNPETQMPTFAAILDPPRALSLATWLLEMNLPGDTRRQAESQ